MFGKILIILCTALFALWAFNTSVFIGPPENGATRMLGV